MFVVALIAWAIVILILIVLRLGWQPEADIKLKGTNIKWKSPVLGIIATIIAWYVLFAVAVLATIGAVIQLLWKI